MAVLIIILIILLVIILCAGVYVVPQQKAYIIERFGKFHTITHPGLHMRIPLIDRIASKVSLKTSQSNFNINAKTKDNVTIFMSIAAQYCVDTSNTPKTGSGIYRSFYILNDPVTQMNSYLTDALRSSIPGYTLDDVFERKDGIAQDVNSVVAELMRQYGYIVKSTLIVNIELPADVESSMNEINAAQRKQAAAQSLAEADRIKVVTEARAEAEKMELQGRGIAAQRTAIAEGIKASLDTIKAAGVSEEEANMLFLYTQYCEMMTCFAKNDNSSTVVLPADFNEHRSMLEQMLVANAASRAGSESTAN